ncbi:Uncharacterised protein [uncultured archaeon]|nr:Uncharacterised protein [uncultured archaeon]
MYSAGTLLALTFLASNPSEALAVVAVLAWGDGMATIAGRLYPHGPKLPFNRKKSFAGTLALAAFGFDASFPFVGFWALPLALICALVESAGLPVDDNLLIPVAGILFLALV